MDKISCTACRQSIGICCMTQEFNLVLCDNLEEWDGVEDGREAQEGGDICIPMADSCECMAETNTII